VSLQLDSYLVQSTGAYPTFDPALVRLTQPLGWFTRWIGVGTSSGFAAGSGTFTVMMNDPVIWALFVPAIAFVVWTAYRRRLPEYWLIAGSFAILYGFFALVDRPIYVYSALSVVPLGAMALGFASGRLLKKWAFVLLGAAVVWSLYLYPLTSALTVPLAPYSWLLSRVGLLGGGG
jgi:dolichyl-phosphate-mannose--protein O-mannosyl transferase